MDVRFINPFISATKTVLKMMMDVDTVISKPKIKDGDSMSADVCAIIGLSGDAVGSVTLCFPEKTATNLAGKFTGEEVTIKHADFADALGELCNMVAGQAKSQLGGLMCSISLPRVVAGKSLKMMDSANEPTLVLPCDTSLGRSHVEVVMKINASKAAANEEQAAKAISA